jgi:hypothetical protein
MKNAILESIRETRERLLAESGGTLEGLVKRLLADQQATGLTVPKVELPTDESRAMRLPPSNLDENQSTES